MTNHSEGSYDFIFLGTGCASLSIVMRMIESGRFADKQFLLIDRASKSKNDRTWCFWEKEAGYFENIIHKKWKALSFNGDDLSLALDMGPYQYKMIRGIDFYNYCFSKICRQPNIQIASGEIAFLQNKTVTINGGMLKINNAIVFNSIYLPPKELNNKFYLLQHFKGWVVETVTDQFDARKGTLMDFRIPQNHGTAFVYVLPLTSKKALVEYTLFTENLLQEEEYDYQLRQYLNTYLNISDYKIVESEFGIIPMTNSKFTAYENGMFNIGTAGGQTKPSTGYTFQFIQKQAAQIVDDITIKNCPSKKVNRKKRFDFYDSTLLHILSKKRLQGKEIFSQLFRENKAAEVFKFLDNETTITEELKIIGSLPTKEFLAAGVKEFFKMM